MPDSVLGKIAVEIGGGTAANGGGGGSPSSTSISGGAGGDSETKKQLGLLGKMRDHLGTMTKNTSGEPRFWTKALKTMGIQVGLAGILKQSQVFTSTLGSLFQILGAFVDVILAPWMPLFVPLLRRLARQVPVVKKWMEGVYKNVTEVYGPWIKSMAIKVKDIFVAVKDKLVAAYDYIKKPDFFSRLISDLSSLALGLLKDLATNGLELLKRGWNLLASNMPEWFTKMFGKLPQFTRGTTSWERRAAEEANKNGGTNGGANGGTNGDKKPVPVAPGMVQPPTDKDDKWRPTKIPPIDAIINAAAEKVKDLGDAFKNADIAEQAAMITAASVASAIANTTLLKSIKIAGQEVNLIRRLLPGMDIATGLTKVFGYPAQKATQLAAFAAKKVTAPIVTKGAQLTNQGIEALIGRKIPKLGTRGGSQAAASLADDAFNMLDDFSLGSLYQNKPPIGTAGRFDEGLDEMSDPNLWKKLRQIRPPKMGSFSFGGVGDEAGDIVGGTSRAKGVVATTTAKVGTGIEKAVNKTKSMIAWLRELTAGKMPKGIVGIANQKLDDLWKAFGPVLVNSPGAKAVPALITRFVKYLIPMAATAFVIGETKHDINEMMKSDMPWLRDPLKMESWEAEGKFWAAGQAMGGGADAFASNAISGLIPSLMGKFGLGDGGEAAKERMKQSQAIYQDSSDVMMENYGKSVFTGTKGQMVAMRLAGALMEGGGSMFGAPGMPVTMGGFMFNEATRQQAGIGIQSENNYFSSGQFMNDFKFMMGQPTKITIDGADGTQYTSGAET